MIKKLILVFLLLVNVINANNIDQCKLINGEIILTIETIGKDSFLLNFDSNPKQVLMVKWNKKTKEYYFSTWAPEDAKFQAISGNRIIYSHSKGSIMFQCTKSYEK